MYHLFPSIMTYQCVKCYKNPQSRFRKKSVQGLEPKIWLKNDPFGESDTFLQKKKVYIFLQKKNHFSERKKEFLPQSRENKTVDKWRVKEPSFRLCRMREKLLAKTSGEVEAKKLLENQTGNLESVKQIAISLVY